MSSYSTIKTGSKYTNSFKVYFTSDGEIISPFHDIPYKNGMYFNVVNEIPRFEHAKFEIATKEKFNPIMQDIKNGKVRFVSNIFPASGYPFNYGAIPQTWENPAIKDEKMDAFGDNDPIDAIEIGSRRKGVGEVYKGKVLGAYALVDDGEADWKIVMIDSEDDLADKLNCVEDIKKHMPGLIEHLYIWLRDYKLPDNKPMNKFGLEGKFLDVESAIKIIEKTHLLWKDSIIKGCGKLECSNKTIKESKGFQSSNFKVEGHEDKEAELPDSVWEFSYVTK
ncbi:uncharacterized protein LOC143922077 [Arctopsyche grandis]|uniref:uncharacterized protein LOC143922077 n=1 Tax=Arctopsyche grandis TaxID=121162 RepID=UPI00406D6D54